MTIRKRLARSNIAMLVIPLLTAAVLALLGAAAVLVLLRGDVAALHGALEQVESILHGFKALLAVYLVAMALLVLLTVAATNVYLTRRLFRHISEPLEVLTAGVARIRDGDLETPIAYGGRDEFRPACDAVDEMAARLRASLEQQQRQQQQKQELIAGMSHDLKSPLTSIRAYTEALLDGVAQDEESRTRYLQTIRAKEGQIETLANRLFAFARLDVSGYPAQLEPVTLLPLLRELTDAWDAEELAISLDVPPALCVTADRELLGRITANLLTNSRKYGGRETVHVRIAARADAENGCAALSFTDDGVGVPPEQLPRLFDAFYRADAARSAPGDGSGLGLAVVKKAAETMHGAALAEAAPGGGLRITVTLPLAKEGEHGR